MRLRTRHAARAGYEVTRPAETPRDDGPTSADVGPCLLAELGVEPGDDAPGTVAVTAAAIRDRADTLGTDRVVLVPDPGAVTDGVRPAAAETVAAAVARSFRAPGADGIEIERVPAGDYVTLQIEAKAHPYADETRRIRPGQPRPEIDERWVVTATGTRRDPASAEGPDALVRYLAHAAPTAESEADERHDRREPGPSLDRLAGAGLAVAGADGRAGGTWLPDGVVVREALTALVAERFDARDASRIATTGGSERATSGGTESTPTATARALLRDAVTDGADLPVRLADTTRPGPDGWARPTMWTAVRSGQSAVEAFERAIELAADACDALALADVVVCQVGTDAPVQEEWPTRVADALARPVVVERRTDATVARTVTATIQATAEDQPPVRLGRVRLDASDEALPEPAWCLTTEPIGSVAAAVDAALAASGPDAPLPTWLAPTQVRLLPIEPTHEPRCTELAAALRTGDVRADVDDRDRAVAARLDDAAGVPFVAVVGDREVDGAPLKARDETGQETSQSVETLRERVAAAAGDRPQREPRQPVRLSARPTVGAPGDGDSER